MDSYTGDRIFVKFYRDMGNPNILYVTSSEGIYKLYGPYSKTIFEKLPEGTRLEDLSIATPSYDQTLKIVLIR